MKSINTLVGLLTLFNVNSQIATTSIQFNNANGKITDAGIFFNDVANQFGGYELPEGSGKKLIYSSAFWFGGKDVNGQLKLAAQDMYNQGYDLWPGALTTDGSANDVTPNPLSQTLWNITRAEINQHITNFNQSGYVVPNSISSWPAHGDVASNQSYYLAPFVDVNFNGDYEPELGDYPCIKGDYAVYTILNDNANIHYSGGYPIGIEVHFMFYQFASNDALNNTTFIDVEIHNRGTQAVYDFATSFMMDGDIGGPTDDFVGCDSTRNLMYQYNGDDYDDDVNGAVGYGTNPPSFGIMLLNDTISSCVTIDNMGPQISNASEMYNLMLGLNINGSPILDDDLNETKFQFYDNPNDMNGWSEEVSGGVPGDRRSIFSVIEPALTPFTSISYSYAVIYSRDGVDNLDNINGLLDVADQIQLYYDNNIDGQCEFTLAVDETEYIEFEVYPNPSNGSFQVDLNGIESNYIVVNDLTGKEIYRENLEGKNNVSIKLNCETGMYIVKIASDNEVWSKKITIN